MLIGWWGCQSYLISDGLEILPSGVVWVQDEEPDLPAGLAPGHAEDGVRKYTPSWYGEKKQLKYIT